MSEPKLSERLQDRYDDDPPDTTVWGWFVENERKEIAMLEAEYAALREQIERAMEAMGLTWGDLKGFGGAVEGICDTMDALRKQVEQWEAQAQDDSDPQIRPMTQMEHTFMDEQKKNAALLKRAEKLEDALEQIVQWAKAYPLDVFPEPDFKKAAKVLKDAGMTLGAISASNMRHVVEGVGQIAMSALATEEES